MSNTNSIRMSADEVRGRIGILGAAYPNNPKWVGPDCFVPTPLDGEHHSLEMRQALIPGCICGMCSHLSEDVPGGLSCTRYPTNELFAKRRLGDLLNYLEATIQGYIYLLKAGPYYKIGRAKNPDERIKTLTIQLPFPVEIVCTIPCDNEIEAEKYLHEIFADQRTNGEWFLLSCGNAASIEAATLWANGELQY